MISAASPGPNAIAQPRCPGRACSIIRCSTNITVAEDMLPKHESTSRDAASASTGSSPAAKGAC